jgi:serine/threonine-protein kinase
MAETFLAEFEPHPGMVKQVAIKRVLPRCAEVPDFLSHFFEEARISLQLSHGNIAQVFDFGEVGGQPYLAMEFVPGATLWQIHERRFATGRGPFDPAPAIYCVMEVCKALQHAHSLVDASGVPMCVVHRDVAPDNVMVTPEGQVKLLDFGIAKAGGAVRAATRPGLLWGKSGFISPEQAGSLPLDGRADVFAAGVMLYLLLTGRMPFEADSEVDFLRLLEELTWAPMCTLRPTIPPELDAVVALTLRRREERLPSALALHDALAEVQRKLGLSFSGFEMARWVTASLDDPAAREATVPAMPLPPSPSGPAPAPAPEPAVAPIAATDPARAVITARIVRPDVALRRRMARGAALAVAGLVVCTAIVVLLLAPWKSGEAAPQPLPAQPLPRPREPTPVAPPDPAPAAPADPAPLALTPLEAGRPPAPVDGKRAPAPAPGKPGPKVLSVKDLPTDPRVAVITEELTRETGADARRRYSQGDFAGVTRLLDGPLARAQGHAALHLLDGLAHLKLGERQVALMHFDEVVRQRPHSRLAQLAERARSGEAITPDEVQGRER